MKFLRYLFRKEKLWKQLAVDEFEDDMQHFKKTVKELGYSIKYNGKTYYITISNKN